MTGSQEVVGSNPIFFILTMADNTGQFNDIQYLSVIRVPNFGWYTNWTRAISVLSYIVIIPRIKKRQHFIECQRFTLLTA